MGEEADENSNENPKNEVELKNMESSKISPENSAPNQLDRSPKSVEENSQER